MNSLLVALITIVAYLLAYRFYARFIGDRILSLDPARRTPAHEREDGVDFVPTRPIILFGHHFASIAGLGPILGPAIAVIWGWLPAALWILFGSIFIGGVHDLSALAVSLRNGGRSIGDVTRSLVGRRAHLLFLVIIFFTLSLCMGTFVRIIAQLFTESGASYSHPESVIPVAALILLAVIVGLLVYRFRARLAPATIVALIAMFASIWLGIRVPVGGIAESTWVWILIAYAFAASVLPVWLLLQPRDYLNAYQLVVGMVLMYAGLFIARPEFTAPALNAADTGAPPIFPFLFITVACGAISGFHSLVATGTTAKQIDRETHALPIGYGGMLAEGLLAMVVVIACTAGISREAWSGHYASWSAAAGLGPKMEAFVVGAGAFVSRIGIPVGIAESFIVVMAVGFAMTTLDSGTRLLRYNLEELGEGLGIAFLRNRFAASFAAVVGVGYFSLMTVDGRPVGLALWELFGTTNQMLGALGLLAVSLVLFRRGKPIRYTAVPMAAMMVIAMAAMIIKLRQNLASRSWPLLIVGGMLLALILWLIVESVVAFLRSREAGKRTP
ncbi:MAG: carbon starvation protein A [Candidatus Krumholzibacteriota bacterium]|nr:carbon starvation protein A [Candidatus Krumholzibacteriota bacterium]